MADEKPKSAGPERDFFRESVEVILFLIIFGGILGGVINFVQNNSSIFRSGWSGLLPHALTLSNTRSISSLENPINAKVLVSSDSTDVLDDAGGNKIGTHSFGDRGLITKGPVMIRGVNYYYVQFDTPPSGWVAENTIVYRDSEPSFFVKVLLYIWKVLSYIWYSLWIIVLVIVGLLWWYIRDLSRLRRENREKLYPVSEVSSVEAKRNPRWEKVMTHIESPNENDWRLAIIEADIILSDLLDTMNLVGDSIGEKLKGVAKGDFTTLDSAWEAHKVRNEIAHSGSDFHINQREALRVIEMYKKVFEEFHFI